MIRPSRVASVLSFVAVLAAATTSFAPRSSDAKGTMPQRPVVVTIGSVAAQLGVKVVVGNESEFLVGASFTGTLSEPEKLATFGIKGMHAGARVTMVRMAPDRVYVEADELEPPSRASARLHLDPDGNIVQPPKA
jgi:hypothetical protein